MAITPGDPSAVPYEIAAPFLRALIYYLATSAEFWQRGGDVLRHELISDPIPKLLAQAVRAVVTDNKEHPGATGVTLVVQRLHTWSLEQFDRPSDPEAQMAFTSGPKNITKEALARCHDYLLEVDPAVFPPMEQVLKEMLPTIKRQLNQEAAKAVLRGLSPLEVEDATRNNQRAQGLLQRVQAVGQPVAVARGLDLDEGWLDGVAAINAVQRFSYGIPELDVLFHGGPPRGELGFVVGAPGEGKCHRKGQGILLFDGRVKRVEDIVAGDRLMGPDNLPRLVLRTNQGRGEMFEVRPNRGGDPWVVNGEHLLTIQESNRRRGRAARLIDVSVREYMTWDRVRKERFKLARRSVDFTPAAEPLRMDPYIMGVILGNGCITHTTTSVSTGDFEVASALEDYAATLGVHVVKYADRGTCAQYRISGGRGCNRENPATAILRHYGLFGHGSHSKFIPQEYKLASREDRLALIAGLIDTDGYHDGRGGFDYITASRRLADDLAFVVRSVGLATRVSPCEKGCQTGVVGTYYRLFISGDTGIIPNRVARKKAARRRCPKNVLLTGFSVVPTETTEDFYGFTLDGDGRYLLDDFTVTHNSMWMSHTWVQMLLARTNVRYATLELSANRIRLRAASNLTGIPMQAIQGQPAAFREAQTRLRWLRENGFLGNGCVKMFPSGVTKLSDIIKWVLDEEQRVGAFIHGVLIDADEHLEVENDQWTDYKGMGKVYAGASAFAQGPDPDKFPELTRWVLFASQAKNLTAKRDDYIKRVEDAADSMRKSRVVDWGITLNVRQPPGLPKTMCLNLGKNRNHDVGVLPDLPTNYACAQPVAVQRAFPWHREPTVWKQMTQAILIA